MNKLSLGPKAFLTPMMVQMIATYNEDGSVDLMNAAWGGLLDTDMLILSLDKSHKTVANILREKAFTLGLPCKKDIVDCDFVGIVSGNKDPKKFEKTDLHATASKNVHAPIIEEFPLTFECETFKIFDDPELGFYLVGKIKNVLLDEVYVKEKKIDVDAMDLCFFSPLDNTYRAYGEKIADAFRAGAVKLQAK